MALFALVPGLPFLPFMLGAAVLAFAAYSGHRNAIKPPALIEAAARHERKKSMGDVLDFDDIHIEFAPNLVGMVLDPATGP